MYLPRLQTHLETVTTLHLLLRSAHSNRWAKYQYDYIYQLNISEASVLASLLQNISVKSKEAVVVNGAEDGNSTAFSNFCARSWTKLYSSPIKLCICHGRLLLSLRACVLQLLSPTLLWKSIFYRGHYTGIIVRIISPI